MKCPHCGIYYDDSERECPMCGVRKPILGVSAPAVNEESSVQEPEQTADVYTTPPSASKSTAPAPGKATGRTQLSPVLIAIIIIVLLQFIPLLLSVLGSIFYIAA